ncbi:MAG: hypothetical protein Tsb0010_09560 [Parvularculaceae bacterium]
MAAALGLWAAGCARDQGAPICLETPLRSPLGEVTGCLSPSEFAERYSALRAADSGATLTLMSPDDDNLSRAASSCADYDSAASEGFYAATTLEMTLEAEVRQYCSALRLLARARRAPEQEPLRVTRAMLLDLPLNQLPYFTETAAPPPAVRLRDLEPLPAIEQTDEDWRLNFSNAEVRLRAVAAADFNGDGRGDRLVLIAARPAGGRIPLGAAGYLTLDPQGAIRLVTSEFAEPGDYR